MKDVLNLTDFVELIEMKNRATLKQARELCRRNAKDFNSNIRTRPIWKALGQFLSKEINR